MAIATNLDLEQTINDKITITDDGLFVIDGDETITAGDLLTAVSYHRTHFYPKYKKEWNYYVGKHDILYQPKKPAWKPDNRIVYNFPKKAITSFNGFFIGTPVKFSYDDQAIDERIKTWIAETDFDDVDFEVSKMSSMYGRAYYQLYQDENGNTLVKATSPMHTFLIYDSGFKQEVRYGVSYQQNAKGDLIITLYDKNGYYKYQSTDDFQVSNLQDGKKADYLDGGNGYIHPFGAVPIIEAPENDERVALCEDILSIIDAMDQAMSAKANDVDYFADAYLVLQNTFVDKDQIMDIRNDRVINISGEGAASADAKFLTKPSADTTQENLINRLVDAMYQISNVVNLNDDAFAGNISGVALQMKFQAMQDMARTKTLKFRKALRSVLTCAFAPTDESLDLGRLKIKFTQTIPHNLTEEAQFVSALYGKIPTRILYQQLSFIDDPDKALEELHEEQAQNMNSTANLMQNAMNTDSEGENSGADREGSQAENSSASKRR